MALEQYRYTEREAEHVVGDMWMDDDGQIRVARGIIVGSTITTPKQKAMAIQHFAERSERWGNKGDLGKYTFAHLSANYSALSDKTLARLFYLATYIKRDTQQLYRKRTPIKECDLPGLLGLSRKTVDRFLSEAKDYITVSDAGFVFLTGDTLTRGKLKKGFYEDLQMLYCEPIQSLYKRMPKSKHALLGLFFRMLPYINREYNILCQNPWEEDIENIIPLSMKEFCQFTGFDYSKISILRKELRKLTFSTQRGQELFCSFVEAAYGRGLIWLFVNPHIVYTGTDYKKVEVLGKFCELQP